MRLIGASILTFLLLAAGEQAASGTAYQDEPQISRPSTSPDIAAVRTKTQPKRILGIFPNYRAVSANTQLPLLSTREKFGLATKDSFDYSSFVLAGIVAAEGERQHSYPEFRQGGAGYAQYFWHSVADGVVGNYMSEFAVPTITREDPRYYTLGYGNAWKRSGYALSRLFVTRTDRSGRTFNFSEIAGNGLGAALSALYYPSAERTWTKTRQKWTTQVALDGVFNVLKEFWPDIQERLPKRQPPKH